MNRALTIFTFFVAVFGFAVLPAMALEAPDHYAGEGGSGQYSTLLRKTESRIQEMRRNRERKKVWLQAVSLNLAYVFNIKNPNKEPIMLDELHVYHGI